MADGSPPTRPLILSTALSRDIRMSKRMLVGAGLPDRNGGVGERPAVDVADAAIEHALAAGLHGAGGLASRRQFGRGLAVDRAEQTGVGAFFDGSVVVQPVD